MLLVQNWKSEPCGANRAAEVCAAWVCRQPSGSRGIPQGRRSRGGRAGKGRPPSAAAWEGALTHQCPASWPREGCFLLVAMISLHAYAFGGVGVTSNGKSTGQSCCWNCLWAPGSLGWDVIAVSPDSTSLCNGAFAFLILPYLAFHRGVYSCPLPASLSV